MTRFDSDEELCRVIVESRSRGLCETCGAGGTLDKAHRVARSQAGKWDPPNILDLCRYCHQEHHRHPTTSYENGWHLRSYQDPSTVAAWLWVRGEHDWFRLTADGLRLRVANPHGS